MATHCPARKTRSVTKFATIIPKPAFSSPMRFCAGTRQDSKTSSAVSLAHQPVFLSFFDAENPAVPRSTTIIEMPPWDSPPVRTATVTKSARTPEVMKVFEPSST